MLSRIRVPLGFLIAGTVFYFATPTAGSLVLGVPIAACGVLVRGLAAGVIRKNSSLATAGAYSYTRNPLYLGSFVLALGFAIASANVTSACLLLLPFVWVYPRVVRSEEMHLERLFGEEFRLYKNNVPQFLPRNLGLKFRNSFSLDQYLANREYNTALGFAGAVAVFVMKWAARAQ